MAADPTLTWNPLTQTNLIFLGAVCTPSNGIVESFAIQPHTVTSYNIFQNTTWEDGIKLHVEITATYRTQLTPVILTQDFAIASGDFVIGEPPVPSNLEVTVGCAATNKQLQVILEDFVAPGDSWTSYSINGAYNLSWNNSDAWVLVTPIIVAHFDNGEGLSYDIYLSLTVACDSGNLSITTPPIEGIDNIFDINFTEPKPFGTIQNGTSSNSIGSPIGVVNILN